MSIGVADLAAAAEKAAAAFATHEAALNAADARLGDGDTGSMLKRLSAAVAAAHIPDAPSPADAFKTMALAASASTGSSLGTLVMAALMAFANGAAGRDALQPADFSALLDTAIETMLRRCGAKPGDKTAIDALIALSEALKDGTSPAAAARAALDAFRDRPNRIGRAGRYGEGSRGLDDPGMLATALLCEALERQG